MNIVESVIVINFNLSKQASYQSTGNLSLPTVNLSNVFAFLSYAAHTSRVPISNFR